MVAIGTVINAYLLKLHYLNIYQVTFTTTFGQVLLFAGMLLVRKQAFSRIKTVIKRAGGLFTLSAVIESAAFLLNMYALKVGPASVVTAVYTSVTVVVIWIGVFFLKEREFILRKLLSSALVTAGIIILKVFV